MTRFVLALLVTAALGAQQSAPSNPIAPDVVAPTAPMNDSPEAYSGQHNHAVPPEGWQCMRAPTDLTGDPSHWCSCERTCDTETQIVHEDKQCAVWCHMDRCTCTQNATMQRCMPGDQNR